MNSQEKTYISLYPGTLTVSKGNSGIHLSKGEKILLEENDYVRGLVGKGYLEEEAQVFSEVPKKKQTNKKTNKK